MQFFVWSTFFALVALTFNVSFVHSQCGDDCIGDSGSDVTCDDRRSILSCYESAAASDESCDLSGTIAAIEQSISNCENETPSPTGEDGSTAPPKSSDCLSGDMIVPTMSGMKLVKDLSIGDMVSVGSGKYEPVVWNEEHLGGNDNVRATFVEFRLSNGEKIAMTPLHFARTTEGDILAENVKVGQFMVTGKGKAVHVENIERTIKKGIYYPQTPSEQIEVNGVIVTTRSKDSPSFMGTIFQVLAFFHSVLPNAVYSTIVGNISHFVTEPLLRGGNTWALSLVALFFTGAGAKILKT